MSDVSETKMPNLRALPALPAAPSTITLDTKNLDKQLNALALARMQSAGVAPRNPNLFQRQAYASLAKAAKPTVEALIKREGETLDIRKVNQAIDSASHDDLVKKTRARSLWIGGGIALGGLVAGGLAGYGLGLGFKWIGTMVGNPTIAETIQTAFNPVWFSVSGMFVGAASAFFNDNISNPLRAWIIRLGMSKTPDKPNFDPLILAEMIHNWAVEQTVDGRVLGMRYAQTLFNTSLQLSMEAVGTELKAARAATDPKLKEEAMSVAAEHLAGMLASSETMWFYITPESVEVFKFMMMLLHPYLTRATEDEKSQLIAKALEIVPSLRPDVQVEGRADLTTAIEKYYKPFLNALMKSGKQMAAPIAAVSDVVAHAG